MIFFSVNFIFHFRDISKQRQVLEKPKFKSEKT